MPSLTFDTPVRELAGVGPSSGERLTRLNLKTAKDLLGHTPYRYDDFSRITPIAQLKPGERTSLRGTIQLIQNRRLFRRHMTMTEALVQDGTASVKVVWFNQPFLAKHLAQGDEIFLAGELTIDRRGPQMVNPTYEKVSSDPTHTARIVPVYHTTARLTQKQLRYYLKQVLPLTERFPDWLPEDIRATHHLLSLGDAVREVHFPTSSERLERSQRRLAFNELLLIVLTALRSKREVATSTAPAIPFRETETKAFVASLPFQLTQSQRRVAWDILRDLTRTQPMNRLLEGDVGSGKTVVATIAMINAALAGFQAVLMVPTEILAQQHFHNLRHLLRHTQLHLALYTRSHAIWTANADDARLRVKRAIVDGRVPIVIGTHALIQESVSFPHLGLAIIDEQHRFGVDQRKLLKEKIGAHDQLPHLLSMTATPIPRSLALTVYGDLDLSVLDEVPSGRKPIATRLVPAAKRDDAYAFVREHLQRGEQAFVICPLIDPSDTLGKRSVTAETEKLTNDVFPEFRVAMIHGKMSADEKGRIMRDFRERRTHVLVATSVIEVGIDIPGATIMLIEDAERFGLAQLHQFRGRIGRNDLQATCLLFTESEEETTLRRLQEVVSARDGFALAEADLRLRGPGEFWGSRQSGAPSLRFADLTDRAFVASVRETAQSLLDADPSLDRHPLVRRKLHAYRDAIHWE